MRGAARLTPVLFLAGCLGQIQDPTVTADGVPPPPTGTKPSPSASPTPTPSPTVPAPPFACEPGAEPTPEVMLRLTRTQYGNVLTDLLTRAFDAAAVQGLLASPALAPHLAALPVDGSTSRAQLVYDSEDQRISTVLVEPQLEIATGVAEWISSDAARLATFVRAFGGGACSAPDAAGCVDAVIEGLGLRALRRPLDAEDRTTYRAAFAATEYGSWRGLIAQLLLAPDFLFRSELRGEGVSGRSDLTRLTAYETASRLSFVLTNSAPDDALLDAARRDFTGADATLDEQVTRLLATPRARAQLEHYHRQWLRLDRVPSFNPSAVAALELDYPGDGVGPLPADLDLAQLRLDAFEELVALMSYYASDVPGGSLRDVLTSRLSFARSAELAGLYGVAPWSGPGADGRVDPATLVSLPAGERAGLFTRAGYLFSGFPDTNPVMRGARLRVEYLCDAMVPPADTSPPREYVPPAVPTVRHLVTAKTEIEGTACRACHLTSINPLGFPFEHYDALGRFRAEEPLHDAQGAVTGWVPVDATTRPDLARNGDPTTVSDGIALSSLLADSPRFHACFARHTFRYLLGRHEETAADQDGCTLAAMTEASRTGSLHDVLRTVVHAPQFALRKLPAGN